MPTLMSDAELIRAYLAEHDAECPKCRYNLRGLGGGACPECAEQITLAIARAEPLRRWLTLVIVALVGIALNGVVSVIVSILGVGNAIAATRRAMALGVAIGGLPNWYWWSTGIMGAYYLGTGIGGACVLVLLYRRSARGETGRGVGTAMLFVVCTMILTSVIYLGYTMRFGFGLF